MYHKILIFKLLDIILFNFIIITIQIVLYSDSLT